MDRSSALLLASLLTVAIGLGMASAAGGDLSAAQCEEEKNLGLNACKPVLYGRLPSPSCCYRVRVSHIECVCPLIKPWMAALIDVNRAIRLIQGCGRRVPRHFKCGSITTP